MTDVLVPDIGDATDVTVVEVLVKPGDTVAREDPIVTLESDKASMDVPCPIEGTVEKVHVVAGDAVVEGSPLIAVAETSAAEPAETSTAEPEPERPETEEPEAGSETPAPPSPVAEPESQVEPAGGEPRVRPDGATDRIHASPLARRLARELDVDLAAVRGTARDGRIGKDDVLAHAIGAPAEPVPPAGILAGLAAWPQVDFAAFGPIETVPLTRIRKLAAANLHRNWVAIPHVTHHDEADVTELEAFRVRTNDEQAGNGLKVTMVALLLKASVAALREHPELNASLEGDSLVLKHYYHLGVAVDTANGLVVPVVRDVDSKGLLELAAELAEVSGRARDRKLTPADLQGGTFSISSLGGIGGTGFTPIVNAPEVAILGVTRTATKPVWDGSAFAPRLMLPLSLSYDHRVIDGAAAARFTRTLVRILEDLRRILL